MTIDANAIATALVGVFSALGGAAGGAMYLRRRLSADNATIAGDRSQIKDLARLQERCDKLEARDSEMRRALTEDAKLIGMLTAEKEHWKSRADQLAQANRALRGASFVPQDVQDVLATRPAPLDMQPSEKK